MIEINNVYKVKIISESLQNNYAMDKNIIKIWNKECTLNKDRTIEIILQVFYRKYKNNLIEWTRNKCGKMYKKWQ